MAQKEWSTDEKVQIVLAALRNEASIAELCRRHGISDATFYKWQKAFLEGGRERLSRRKGPNGSPENELHRQNEELKKALAEATLELRVVKKTRGLL